MKVLVSIFLAVVTLLIVLWWKSAFALPIFCTTRGCVTTIEWNAEKNRQSSFATIVQSSPPSETTILTTLVRRHLLSNLQKPGNIAEEAIKYRTNVLHLTQEPSIQQLGFESFSQYDTAVTIPFLLQQAYINEHKFQSPADAYIELSKHSYVLSLLFQYKWDGSKGEVIVRD